MVDMDSENSINLLSPRSKLSERLSTTFEGLHRASLVGLVTLVGMGVLVGVLYLFFNMRYNTLVARRDTLLAQVSSEVEKESALVALHQRAQLTDKLLANQITWGSHLGRISEIVQSPKLSSISVDEKHRLAITVKTNTIEDNFPILSAFVHDVEEKKIISPEIVSFQFEKDGKTNLVVSFFPGL